MQTLLKVLGGKEKDDKIILMGNAPIIQQSQFAHPTQQRVMSQMPQLPQMPQLMQSYPQNPPVNKVVSTQEPVSSVEKKDLLKSQTTKKEDSKKEPIEARYPEFLVFRLNNLEHKHEEAVNRINEEIERIKEQVNNDITQLLSFINSAINSKVPEFVENKIDSIVHGVVEDKVNELKVSIDSLAKEMNYKYHFLNQRMALTQEELRNVIEQTTIQLDNLSEDLKSFKKQLDLIQEKTLELEKQIKYLKRIEEIPKDMLVEPVIESKHLVEYQDDYCKLPEWHFQFIDENKSGSKGEGGESKGGDTPEVKEELYKLLEEQTNKFLSGDQFNESDLVDKSLQNKTIVIIDEDYAEDIDDEKEQLKRLISEIADDDF